MLIAEVSFREWVVCKVRQRKALSAVAVTMGDGCARPRVRTNVLVARRSDDRRGDLAGDGLMRHEQRRKPERRVFAVEETSFDEFERWKNGLKFMSTGGKR